MCDMQSAYWQILVTEKDKDRTAFVTQKDKCRFKVLPFGIANALWVFQRVMALMLANLRQNSGLLV